MPDTFRCLRIFFAVVSSVALAACGGNGDSNSDKNGSYNCTGSGTVSIEGAAAYEFVPAVSDSSGTRLDYGSSSFKPIRQAEVQGICPDGSIVYDTTVSNDAGEYALAVPGNVDVAIRVRASMVSDGVPAWDVSVVDNTADQAVWAGQGEAFNSETGSVTVDLQVTSGWDGSDYSATRAAAPFAILDSVYTAMKKIMAAEPTANFPALKLNWSPGNKNSCTGDLNQDYPFPDGCIGTSFFANFGGSAGRNIFILGEAGNDTDEYDNHVIIHEWAHYYENAFARSDSIGGAHRGGDALDPRVAFGEGWGNAFSGIATDDPLYVDTQGSGQNNGFSMDVESGPEGAAGWWNEGSVQEIIYDLYDAANDDAAAFGFAPIHDVLTTGQKTTGSVASIFSFIHFLKQDLAANAADIREVVASHDIAQITDEWGTGRENNPVLGSNDDGSEFGAGHENHVSPVHRDLMTITTGSTPIVVCTSNNVDQQSASEFNRLGARRFLRFQASSAGRWQISVAGETVENDPDFYVFLRGTEITNRNGAPDSSGANDSTIVPNPDGGDPGIERAVVALSLNETYVLEVMDYLNIDENDMTGGELCLDIMFEKL